MSDEISLDNLDVKNAWEVLETMGMDKILGITQDEFVFIASLPQNMDENEIIAQLLAYRKYREIKYSDNKDTDKK